MAATEYGVTVNGFVRKRLPETIANINANLEAAWGAPVSTKANSVVGQLVGVFAAEIDDLWQLAEDTYNAMYPNTAKGVSLRNSGGFAGVTALNAAKTKIYAVCYGDYNTTITKDAQIQGKDGAYYEAYVADTISLSNAVSLAVTLVSVSTGTTYSVTIAGTTVSKTAGAADTVNSVLVALTAGLPTGWSASVVNNVLIFVQTDRINGAVVSVSSTLTIVNVYSPIVFYATETGALDPAIGTVTKIITQIAGWRGVSNESDAYPGRAVETDTGYRQRYSSVVPAQGRAMTEAIRANLLQNVSGVTAAVVFENDDDVADAAGRPPHSIEAVVQGGDDEEVAAMIWKTKAPASTYGSVSVVVIDSQSIPHTIKFNRPTGKRIWLRCTVHEHPEIELAGDALQTTAGILLARGQAHEVGQDVILEWLKSFVYQSVQGISYLELEGSTDGATYNTTNISIGVRELATFNSTDIEVTTA